MIYKHALGTLPGFLGSEGVSINNSGIVVGNFFGNIFSPARPPYEAYTYVGAVAAFLYDGKMHNLSDLVDGNWEITAVGHINDAGQMAATGVRPGSAITYALLVTPKLGR
jgi:hypothetical protein